ncbi:hypothetical protein DH2020_047008 [Rehmannia glutinosa]|uniref:Cellulose synthase n=1 Tax=Rehmannia glutinosa TaxID=99300 RepID=A0ABR0UAR0_REHGL
MINMSRRYKYLKHCNNNILSLLGGKISPLSVAEIGIVLDREGKTSMNMGSQVCQICSDNVGLTVDGEPFVACDVCAFPVCRPCYEYERKDGNQSCPQCKTRYKRHKGSPAINGDGEEDGAAADGGNYSENQNDKQKISERMLSWHMSYGKGEDIGAPKYDKEVSHNHIPLLTNATDVSGEFSAASPGRLSMASPPPGGAGKPRIVDPVREFGSPGLGNVAWKERVDGWKMKQEKPVVPMTTSHPPSERGVGDIDASTDILVDDSLLNDEARQPLSRKVSIPSSRINPYRMVIVLRLVIICIFLHYRITNPVPNAYILWLISVICEIWFAISWILDQFPKWLPVNRETYLDRLALRYDREGEPSQLAAVDIFVSTVDPLKEPPLVTANTVLSILSVDYPVDKVSCYVSDDGAAMLTFEALSETSEFARKWVPFCKSTREYEEFKIRVNALVAKAQKVPEEGWIMQDGTPWPGNNTRDHPGMIQVFLGQSGGLDSEGNELPRLVRVSAVLTNGPFLLNLDCDHYINNSKALREAMCFLMDPNLGKYVCYVQFPQRFDGIDKSDRYANRNTVFFDINLRGLDGIQGPVYVGTGCVFNRTALYGYEPPHKPKHKKPGLFSSCFGGSSKKSSKSSKTGSDKKKSSKHVDPTVPIFSLEDIEEGVEGAGFDDEKSLLMSQMSLEKRFGQSAVFVAHLPNGKWWCSSVCNTRDSSERGHSCYKLWSTKISQNGEVRLKWLERFAYVNTTIYPVTAIPLLLYCTLPAVCLLTGKFIIPQCLVSIPLSLHLCYWYTRDEVERSWDRRMVEKRTVLGYRRRLGSSIRRLQGLLKVLAGIDTNFTVTSKASDEDGDFTELYMFKWTTLLIPPTTLLIVNIVGVVAGISYAINSGYQSWGPLFGKLFFAFWVIVHLYPFLKGLMGRQNRTPTIVVVWSILLASIFSLLWVRVDPFTTRVTGPDVEQCGINC